MSDWLVIMRFSRSIKEIWIRRDSTIFKFQTIIIFSVTTQHNTYKFLFIIWLSKGHR